jgi:hypothetical protein
MLLAEVGDEGRQVGSQIISDENLDLIPWDLSGDIAEEHLLKIHTLLGTGTGMVIWDGTIR